MTIFKKSLALKQLSLKDVQSLFGGQNFYLKGDGTAYIEVVKMREAVKCRRFKVKLTNDQLKELNRLLKECNFFSISISNRPGLPDEASSEINVLLISGEKKTVTKWASDKHPDFDSIYNWLLNIIRETEVAFKPFYAGNYQYDWKPNSND